MSRSEKKHEMGSESRVRWLDNLRTCMVFLVVLCHAGGVYESSGVWASFWIVDDPATNNLAGIVFLILDIFMMPTLFFISGYFVPRSIKHRTAWAFLRSKFKRLIIPWTLAVLTLVPLYKVIFLYSRGLPREHWTSYFHWSNGIWSQNWLWFLPVLFLFNLLYALVSWSGIRMPKLSVRSCILLAMLLGIGYSLAMDVLGLQGWTKTFLLDFQNERLLIYFITFLLGALCCQRQVFDARPKGSVLYYGLNATAWIPITVYIIFLLYPWLHAGRSIVSGSTDRLIRWSCFHLSLCCIMYLLIESFRRCQAKQGAVRQALGRNSYSVYIIHVIVMGIIALPLLNSDIPSLWKYLILTVSTYGLSQLIVHCGRRIMNAGLSITAGEKQTMKSAISATVLITVLAVSGCSERPSAVPSVDLHTATVQGNIELVQQHIAAGSDLNAREPMGGSTALITAATFGRTEVALALIEAGADLNCQNRDGSSALLTAAFFCRTEIVQALLDKGADRTLRNKAGKTALEAVTAPFDRVRGIYESIGQGLEPLGLRLDYERLERIRPEIVEMLR